MVGRIGIVALAAGAVLACAARTGTSELPVLPELETEAIRATAPDSPLHVIFDWSAREPDARFTGRGVARIQGPYHARIDLFGPRSEGYLSAAIVDDDLRIPPSVSPADIPPVPLLWSVIGVFRPPPGATLSGTLREGTTTRLTYEQEEGTWTFRFEEGRLRHAEWNRAGGYRYTVELEGRDAFGLPRRVVYRDWAAFTELTLELDEVERVEPFAADVWTPGQP